MRLNNKELQILSIILLVWSVIFIGSGLALNKTTTKKIVKEKYSLNIEKKKIPVSQAKINEIKLKQITLEINNPISTNVADYLENPEQISNDILKKLQLDTSLVNINEAGTYEYSVTCNKKKYTSQVIIKEKELPDVDFTLKNLEFDVGTTLSLNPRSYIKENISDEVYNHLDLNLKEVNQNVAGTYSYYITYKNTTYKAQITMKQPGPTVQPPSEAKEEEQK